MAKKALLTLVWTVGSKGASDLGDFAGETAFAALSRDDECDARGAAGECSLNALQMRIRVSDDSRLNTGDDAAGDCHTAVEGEDCYDGVIWAKTQDIIGNPENYPGLTILSRFEEFQALIHKENATLCESEPCAAPPEVCKTAEYGDACFKKVTWARNDGIYGHPEWFPELQAGSSSLEQFQDHLHALNATDCPKPCLLTYPNYSTPSYRSARDGRVMKGISYGPSPLKRVGVRLTDDDWMSDIAGVMWADWGRGDMRILRDMGANTMRMYGNDPNVSKRTFMDSAMTKGIDIIAGMSDWPYLQSPEACGTKNHWYCYDQVYESYKENLLHGFTLDGHSTYHPALKAMILINEPDLKVIPRTKTCRAVASAFDAVLQAEKDLGVTGNPIAITVTWSFAAFNGKPPALGQMEEFYNCLHHPERYPTHYKPKNNLLEAFKARWVNSFNTANEADSVMKLTLDKYGKIFWNPSVKIPVFIGEYHNVHTSARSDLRKIVATAQDPEYPFFLGLSFFEFSVRYDKGGTEKEFGMFGYGNCALAPMNYSGKAYNVWNLVPMADASHHGDSLFAAVTDAYGGTASKATLYEGPCMMHPLTVT